MKEIYLSCQGKNKNKYVAFVDDEDYYKVSKYRWHVHFNKSTYYAKTNIGNGKKLRMHRFIMDLKDFEYVDHIDGNGYNNKKNNLRICNLNQNSCNRKSSGEIKYLGVYIMKIKNKGKIYKYYRANITKNNKGIYLGLFKSAEKAAIAYNNAAIKYHGDFARINIINND